MSYDAQRLARTVRQRLSQEPLTSLTAMAAALGVERHTITRVCRSHLGLTFRRLQAEYVGAWLRTLLSRPDSMSIKEISRLLGYKHPRSLARKVRRETGRTPTALRSGDDTRGLLSNDVLAGQAGRGTAALSRPLPGNRSSG